MKIAFLILAYSLLQLTSAAQSIDLIQKVSKDDFIIRTQSCSVYFHKTDILKALDTFSLKLKMDNAKIRSEISDGTLAMVDIPSKSLSDKAYVELIESLGGYLLLKGKAAIYKGPLIVSKILVDEAPPEVELDGTKSNIFFFSEVGSTNWFMRGSIRTELRN